MKFIDRADLDVLLDKPYPDGQGPILIDVASADTEVTLSGAHRVDFDRIVLNRDNIAGLLPNIDTLRYDLSRHHTQAEDISAGLDQWLIVDARSTDEFVGTDRRSKHAGHIPGALHFDWSWCFDPAKPGYLRPDTELLALLAEHGISPNQNDRPIAVYCQSHRRSSLLFCVLKHLGFNDVRGYPGAWSDWGNRDDVPISCPQNPAADQPI